MCKKHSDDSSQCNSIDVFLSDEYKVPNELKKAMEDEIEYSSLMKPEQKIQLNELKEVILKKININIEDATDIEILNGWEFTEKTKLNPAMRKYILTVVAITMK